MSTPGKIGAAEDWLVAECTRLAGSQFKSIEPGPGDWSDAYLKRLLQAVPAIRVVFEGGEAAQPRAEYAVADTRWAVYVAIGWRGADRGARRRGKGAQPGAYRTCELLAGIIHHSVIKDVGQVHYAGIRNLWSGEIDANGLAVYGIGFVIPMVLEPDPLVLAGQFHDFLTAGIAWDLPGVGTDEDAADIVKLPKAEPTQ